MKQNRTAAFSLLQQYTEWLKQCQQVSSDLHTFEKPCYTARGLQRERRKHIMFSFANDYSEGAHPEILKKLTETNTLQTPGYGEDCFTASAGDRIREACFCPDADVYFLAGGTQTNAVILSVMLRPYEGVLCASTGHIAVHEAGAVEYTGHKVLPLPSEQGKVDAAVLENWLRTFFDDPTYTHMVIPGMVYLSQPTELGTLYSWKELQAIHTVCQAYRLRLYVDGARLITALSSPDNDVSLHHLCEVCDAFYIGGTKAGTFFGEAVVFPSHGEPEHFATMVKQHGAMMAKGRILGIQFDTLFTGDLYRRIGKHTIETAFRLRAIFHDHGIPFSCETSTNQQFVILNTRQAQVLEQSFRFERWEVLDDDRSVYRFVTSWATTEESLKALDSALEGLV